MSDMQTSFRPAIGLVGAGRFGLALSQVVAQNGHRTVLYTSLPERAAALNANRCLPEILPELEALDARVEVTNDPQFLAEHCGLILVTVSSEYFLPILKTLGSVLDGAHAVVHAVHQVHGKNLTRVTELIGEYSCVRQVGVIAGPTHVRELLHGLPNAAVVGSAFPGVVRATRRALDGDIMRVYGNNDVIGVELAAALGQVVALATGIADGLELGAATHATLMTRGFRELALLGAQQKGARESTFAGLAGVGRLIDAVRRGEPNYQFGLDLARAPDVVDMVQRALPEVQGIPVVNSLAEYTAWHGYELPIAGGLNRVLKGELDIRAAVTGWMKLDELYE
jgi:glycerol-3-phosphate dehydrogenase (NAD(P)+)